VLLRLRSQIAALELLRDKKAVYLKSFIVLQLQLEEWDLV
jgi:hypothetical protein